MWSQESLHQPNTPCCSLLCRTSTVSPPPWSSCPTAWTQTGQNTDKVSAAFSVKVEVTCEEVEPPQSGCGIGVWHLDVVIDTQNSTLWFCHRLPRGSAYRCYTTRLFLWLRCDRQSLEGLKRTKTFNYIRRKKKQRPSLLFIIQRGESDALIRAESTANDEDTQKGDTF